MSHALTETIITASVQTVALSRDQDSIVTLVRGENLSIDSARAELALCSLDRVRRENVVVLPTPSKEYWWTARLRKQKSAAGLAVPESIALAAGLIVAKHAPEGWICGVLTAEDSEYFLSLFSPDGIFGRMTIHSPAVARLGIDLRQALNSSLPFSIKTRSAPACDALYVSEEFPSRDAAALAETLQILVERIPTDRAGLQEAGRKFLCSEISRLCG